MSEEGEIQKAQKVKDSKKGAVAYLRSVVEERDRSMAQHFAKGNFALAMHDAKRMTMCLELLSEIDLNS